MPDTWYPDPADYWVRPEDADKYPRRYGDVFAAPDVTSCKTDSGTPWAYAQVLTPSCELGAKGKATSRIALGRVRPVTDMPETEHPRLRLGWSESEGVARVAYGYTFWMPPMPGTDEADHITDFRQIAVVNLEQLPASSRVAALTHDARLHLIRRELYYKYRWKVSLDEVRANEVGRIGTDSTFEGPRPTWAPLADG
jgi:hypothetical protein